jgi:hypothetical protein
LIGECGWLEVGCMCVVVWTWREIDHGVSVWSYGSGLACGVTVWTFGLDFWYQFILRQPECATLRNRKSKPELHINNY